MSRDTAGTYTLPLPVVVTGAVIEASWANTTMADIGTALTDSLSRTGNGNMSVALKAVSGTVSAPGLAWVSEANTGLYRSAANDIRMAVAGADICRWTASTGFQVYVRASWKAVVPDADSDTKYYGRKDAAWAEVVGLAGTQTITGVKTFSSDPLIPDEAYGSGWNGVLEPPTKNAVYDKLETVLSSSIRERLAANRTYYVRTDGSDSNNGLADSAGGAFLTIQKGIDVASTLDFYGYTVVVQVKDGTYTGAVIVRRMTGCDSAYDFILRGNVTTPSNCVISTTSAHAIRVEDSGTQVGIEGFKLQTTTSGHCLQIYTDVFVSLANLMVFGACADNHINMVGGFLTITSGYTINGNADYHYSCDAGATITFNSACTVSSTPAFANKFAYAGQNVSISLYLATFTGSATGTRYLAELCGTINTYGGGASYFPGNSAGSTATGGQYA